VHGKGRQRYYSQPAPPRFSRPLLRLCFHVLCHVVRSVVGDRRPRVSAMLLFKPSSQASAPRVQSLRTSDSLLACLSMPHKTRWRWREKHLF